MGTVRNRGIVAAVSNTFNTQAAFYAPSSLLKMTNEALDNIYSFITFSDPETVGAVLYVNYGLALSAIKECRPAKKNPFNSTLIADIPSEFDSIIASDIQLKTYYYQPDFFNDPTTRKLVRNFTHLALINTLMLTGNISGWSPASLVLHVPDGKDLDFCQQVTWHM